MSDTTDSQVIQRYEVQSYDSEAWMNPEDDGGYITYADHQAAIATMQKELADFEEDLATYMQISNDLTNENVEFCNKIENQTKELAECQLANKQMRDALAEIKLDSTDINSFRTADKALSIPSTTDALDAYVSEAVKVEREVIVNMVQSKIGSTDEYPLSDLVKAIRERT